MYLLKALIEATALSDREKRLPDREKSSSGRSGRDEPRQSQQCRPSTVRKLARINRKLSVQKTADLLCRHGAKARKALRLINSVLLEIPEECSGELCELLRRQYGVERLDDDIEVQYMPSTLSWIIPWFFQPSQKIPWGVERIRATSLDCTGKGVKIGVIDTGINTRHPDLYRNIKGGVRTLDYGWDYLDDNNHGTHVAGIIGAADNSIGVLGVAPESSIYSIKALDENGKGYLSDIIEGLEWAMENGIDIVNMSIGANATNESFTEAIKAASAAGLIMVASAGNNGPNMDTVTYPARYKETIAVAASDRENRIADFSSRGREVDLAAPGVDIDSTLKSGFYGRMSGTSMAAPHIAGVIALSCQVNGKLSPEEAKDHLMRSSEPLSDIPTASQGAGLINARKAIEKIKRRYYSHSLR